MATYEELRGLFSHGEMLNKVEVACIIAAETIRTEDGGTANHANRLLWAKAAFENPNQVREQMWKAMLAANESASVATLTTASDSVIQAAVDAAIDVFADGS